MKSLIAALQSLVLPFGATSGRRIILDGVNGEIAVYDASGTLRLRLGGVDAEDRIRAYTGDVAEQLGADFATAILGAGADRQLALFIDAPQLDGQAFPSMTLISQSFDGTVLSNMQYAAAHHTWRGIPPVVSADRQQPPRQFHPWCQLVDWYHRGIHKHHVQSTIQGFHWGGISNFPHCRPIHLLSIGHI